MTRLPPAAAAAGLQQGFVGALTALPLLADHRLPVCVQSIYNRVSCSIEDEYCRTGKRGRCKLGSGANRAEAERSPSQLSFWQHTRPWAAFGRRYPFPCSASRGFTCADNAEGARAQTRKECANAFGACYVGGSGEQGAVLGVRRIVGEGLRRS